VQFLVRLLKQLQGYLARFRGADNWVDKCIREFEALRGQAVVGWQGVEMALFEEGPDGRPQFEVAGVPVTQLSVLWLLLADHRVVAIQTYQVNDEFALGAEIVGSPSLMGDHGIWRDAQLGDLPTAIVSGVQIRLSDRGYVSEVELSFDGGRAILLVAGEANETGVDKQLYFVPNDESVLLFREPSDVSALAWR